MIEELRVHQIELEMQNLELKETQENLIHARNKYHNIYNIAPVGYLVLDKNSLIKETNLSFSNLIDVSIENLINKPLTLYVTLKSQDAFSISLEKALLTNEKIGCEIALRKKGGRNSDFFITTQMAINFRDGNFFVAVTDITENKKIELALKENERKYRTLVSNVPGVIFRCIWESSWVMKFISKKIEEISNYPASDFINNKVRSYSSIIHPDDQDFVFNLIQENIEIDKKQAYKLDYRIIDSHGEIKWIHENGQGVYSNTGQLLYIDGVITDITERKMNEIKINEQNAKQA